MSYEGSEYFLCEKGHLNCFDAYSEEEESLCRYCGSRLVWNQSVDYTNGTDITDPHTYLRDLEVDHYEDIPMEDHYGNKYFSQKTCYKIPDDPPGARLFEKE